MLTRARELSRQEGLCNISFVQADAQIHRFPPERFDLAISRFGIMFFANPVAAFTNIRGTLRPSARLVWQDSNHQEWSAVIREVFAGEQAPPAATADPFSLADPATAGAILTASGFTDAAVTGLHEPVCYGPDTATALDAVLTLQMTKDLLAPLDAARSQHALNQLRAALAAHQSRNGVLFDSHAWLITARRPDAHPETASTSQVTNCAAHPVRRSNATTESFRPSPSQWHATLVQLSTKGTRTRRPSS